MNKKLIGILLIIISFIIALFVLYFVFFYTPPKAVVIEPTPEPVRTPIVTTTVNVPVEVVRARETTPPPVVEVNEESARQTAGSFAQLYGTYSNQDDLSRVNDLKFYVTSKYLASITVALKNANQNYQTYTGYVTRAITSRSLIMEANRSVMMVSTKRSERKDDGTERNYTQDIKVELVVSGKNWKVDNAVWQ